MDNHKETRRMALKVAKQKLLEDLVKHPVFYGLAPSFKTMAITNNKRYKRTLKMAGDTFDKTAASYTYLDPLEIRGITSRILRHRMRYLMN